MIHPRGSSTGCRAWRGRSACCGRMSRCPALSRAYRLLGFRRGLGVGVGIWSGKRIPMPATDRRRAGHRPRGKPNLSVGGHLARDLRQPDSPPRPCLSRTRRHRGSIDRRRPSCRTAATLTRTKQAERAWANPALEQAGQTSRFQPIEGVPQPARKKCDPRKGQGDDPHAGVWEQSGDTRSRSTDLKLRRPHEMSSRSLGATQTTHSQVG